MIIVTGATGFIGSNLLVEMRKEALTTLLRSIGLGIAKNGKILKPFFLLVSYFQSN